MQGFRKMLSRGSAAKAILILAVLLTAGCAMLLGPSTRDKVARTRADLRSLATGLESYFIDNNAYPAMTNDPQLTANADLASQNPGANWSPPAFRRKENSRDLLRTLTTPVSYIVRDFVDPFATPSGRRFSYYQPQGLPGWLIWSPGPDGDYDLEGWEYDPTRAVPSPEMINKTYDPSNGLRSDGDVYRVKQ